MVERIFFKICPGTVIVRGGRRCFFKELLFPGWCVPFIHKGEHERYFRHVIVIDLGVHIHVQVYLLQEFFQIFSFPREVFREVKLYSLWVVFLWFFHWVVSWSWKFSYHVSVDFDGVCFWLLFGFWNRVVTRFCVFWFGGSLFRLISEGGYCYFSSFPQIVSVECQEVCCCSFCRFPYNTSAERVRFGVGLATVLGGEYGSKCSSSLRRFIELGFLASWERREFGS